jgi:RNA polymerase sporulation-specific sigma factor
MDKKLTDEQLVKEARCGNAEALDAILNRYKKHVLSFARRFFLTGGETEDLVQEGMCGLYSALESYTEGKSSFSTYAYSCIHNRICDAVKSASSQKNAALNNALPIVEVGEELNFLQFNPEDEVIEREERSEFLQKMSKVLSAFEFQVIVMYIDGLSVADIAKAVGKSVKSVDNATTRAKRKLGTLYRPTT